MGYYTNFTGSVTISPPLNSSESGYLTRLANTRRMARTSGPYSTLKVERLPLDDGDITDRNAPPEGQPGLYCEWAPSESGERIEWNHNSAFYCAPEWMIYLISQFLAPDASLAGELESPLEGRYYAPEFAAFTFDHILTGHIDAAGEAGERWRIVVDQNRVSTIDL